MSISSTIAVGWLNYNDSEGEGPNELMSKIEILWLKHENSVPKKHKRSTQEPLKSPKSAKHDEENTDENKSSVWSTYACGSLTDQMYRITVKLGKPVIEV